MTLKDDKIELNQHSSTFLNGVFELFLNSYKNLIF